MQVYFDHIVFDIPSEIDVLSLIPEWEICTSTRMVLHHGMVRVADPVLALKAARYRGSGEAVVRVEDALLPENTANYRIRFADDRAVSVERVEDAPDVTMSVANFSRFLVGTHSFEGVCDILGADAVKNKEELSKIFYRKPNFIAEHF